jgi:hypothetical protein
VSPAWRIKAEYRDWRYRKRVVVFIQVAGPVGSGFVDNLARPGGIIHRGGVVAGAYAVIAPAVDIIGRLAARDCLPVRLLDGVSCLAAWTRSICSAGVATFVELDLRGAKPSDLPVGNPAKHELVIK